MLANDEVRGGLECSGAAEQVYFLRMPVAHIAEWEERLREQRQQRATAAVRARRPFKPSLREVPATLR